MPAGTRSQWERFSVTPFMLFTDVPIDAGRRSICRVDKPTSFNAFTTAFLASLSSCWRAEGDLGFPTEAMKGREIKQPVFANLKEDLLANSPEDKMQIP